MSAATEMRFKLAIAHDPWMFPIRHEPFDLITQPVLCINTDTMDYSANNRKMKELFNNMSGDERQVINIDGSKHLQQSDIPYVFGLLSMLFTGKFYRRSIQSLDVHDLTCSLSLKFISKFLGMFIYGPTPLHTNLKKNKIRFSFFFA